MLLYINAVYTPTSDESAYRAQAVILRHEKLAENLNPNCSNIGQPCLCLSHHLLFCHNNQVTKQPSAILESILNLTQPEVITNLPDLFWIWPKALATRHFLALLIWEFPIILKTLQSFYIWYMLEPCAGLDFTPTPIPSHAGQDLPRRALVYIRTDCLNGSLH